MKNQNPTTYKQANENATPVTGAMLAAAVIKNDAAGATGNVTVFPGTNRPACKHAVVTSIFSMTNVRPCTTISFDSINRNGDVVDKGAWDFDSPIFVLANTGLVLRLVKNEEGMTVDEAIEFYAAEGIEASKGYSSDLYVSVEGLHTSVGRQA